LQRGVGVGTRGGNGRELLGLRVDLLLQVRKRARLLIIVRKKTRVEAAERNGLVCAWRRHAIDEGGGLWPHMVYQSVDPARLGAVPFHVQYQTPLEIQRGKYDFIMF
jgi:hypothetical protein